MLGRTLGHYRLLEPLGRGGMGQVFVAEDTRLGRKVALKILLEEIAKSPQNRARFEREARAVASLSHPNILAIHDFGEDNGVAYAVAELLEGDTLRGHLSGQSLPRHKALDYAAQLIAGLTAAHEKGVVHRDLKPENIFITRDERLKILDFGLAGHDTAAGAEAKTHTRLTEPGAVIGTAAYMSPEQVRGEPADARSDIFSAGIIVFEMLTRRSPFARSSTAETMAAILRDAPPELTDTLPDAAPIGRLLRRCLDRDPAQRFQSARDLGFALDSLSAVPAAASRKRRRPPLGAWLAAGAIVAALAGTAALYVRTRSETPATTTETRRLVVLPLENLGTAEDEYFAAGLTEEITSRLAAIPGLAVISKNSAFQYSRSGKTTKQAGVELGVTFILSGSIRWDRSVPGPGRLRVTPQLVRVSDDTTVWTQRYDGVLSEIFNVQANIAEQVARELNLAVSGATSLVATSRPTANLKAYEAYLLGVYQDSATDRVTAPVNARVIETLERAVTLDPGFALAHARLSIGHSMRYVLAYDRTEARLDLARRSAESALRLQPSLALGHTALGSYHYARAEYDEALREFEVAQRSAPADSYLLRQIAAAHRRRGQLDQAVASFTRALDLDPLSAELQRELAATLFTSRQYDNAISHFDLSIAAAPGQVYAYWEKAWAQVVGSGSVTAARATLERMPNTDDPDVAGWAWVWFHTLQRDYLKGLAAVDALPAEGKVDQNLFQPRPLIRANFLRLLGRHQQARAEYDVARLVLERERDIRPEDARVHIALALAYAGLARTEEALREGQRALDLLPPSKNSAGLMIIEDMARVCVLVGRFDTALDHIERLLSVQSRFSTRLLELDPAWDPLRDHPRYRKLMDRYAGSD